MTILFLRWPREQDVRCESGPCAYWVGAEPDLTTDRIEDAFVSA